MGGSTNLLVRGDVKAMRVIVVMVEPPLPFGSAAARWFYVLLKGLTARGHRVTALAACNKPEEIARAAALFPKPEFDLRCYRHPRRSGLRAKWETLRRPYSYMFSDEMKADLRRELAAGFDVLHLEEVWAGRLGQGYESKALVNLLNLYNIDLHSSRSKLTPWMRLQRRFLKRAELQLLRGFRNVSTLTPRLTEAVGRINPRAAVYTVPLGMDLSLYPYRPPERDGNRPPTVGLIGSFNWEPTFAGGHRLLTRLWPEIKRRIPDARLHLIGRSAKALLGRFVSGPHITVEENVAEILPYFRGLDVLLYAPDRASGMKVKILEAFALGTPVVTNRDGVEGLAAEDGIHAGIHDEDSGLIDRAVARLTDVHGVIRQAAAARQLVEETCGPDTVLDRLEGVYAHLTNGAAPHAAAKVLAVHE
jgi:glycosyltransferase involved in cell wall biosynthesis